MKDEPVIVVLDDDPTGTQTVHNVTVLTSWEPATVEQQFRRDERIFYILTNSRSVAEPTAVDIARQVGAALLQAATRTNKSFQIISRSDSTLRGHFPAEVLAVAEAAAIHNPLVVLAPAFFEGGRITEDDVHYLVENGRRTPVADTAFAKDPVFGYQHSNLREWAREKAPGLFQDEEIISLSIEALHTQSVAELSEAILREKTAAVLVVNALTYDDLAKAAEVLWQLWSSGRALLIRSAASLVRVMAGIQPQPLLKGKELKSPQNRVGGLIIVGSFVPRTTEQLAYLRSQLDLPVIEVAVQEALTNPASCAQSIRAKAEPYLRAGKTVLVQSERRLVVGNSAEESLQIGQQVSATLVQVVRQLTVLPSFIIAKGGITSSDIATQGMQLQRATVRGQILPGVPVWQAEPTNRFFGIPYVVFPGNVGDQTALYDVISQFM